MRIVYTKKRSRMIKEKCDITIECTDKMKAECEKGWDEQWGDNNGV